MTQPTTERRTRVRTHGPACTADQCQQACELPGADVDPLHDEPATAFEIAGVVIFVAAFVSLVLIALKACASA